MLSNIFKKFNDSKYVIIDKVFFRKLDNEIRYTSNVNESFEILLNYLPYVKNIVKSSKRPKFVNKLESKELNDLIYYSYIYYLIHWDNIDSSKQIAWQNWFNFKKTVDKNLKNEYVVVLDYIRNIDFYEKYISKKFPNEIKRYNEKNIFLKFFGNFHGFFMVFYLLMRKLTCLFITGFSKTSAKYDKNMILAITDYDRYYDSKGFFNSEIFSNAEFKEYLKLNFNTDVETENIQVVYTKYSFKNFLKYLITFKNDNKSVFLEDILDFHIGLEIFIHGLLNIKKNKNFPIVKTDENIEFIDHMYEDFMKNKFLFSLWFYLSVKKYIENNNVKIVIGDSEKNLLYFFFSILRKNSEYFNTIAFSHEVIIPDHSFYLPFTGHYDDSPDLKFVWNEGIKKLLVDKYNYSEDKIAVLDDPRFLKWKSKKFEKKSILFISQGYSHFYEDLIDFFKNETEKVNFLKSKGFKFYFKPHPAEFLTPTSKKYLEEIMKSYNDISVIDNLDFIPEYGIGVDSTLVYELMRNGTKVFFLSLNNIFMIEKEDFQKCSKKSISDVIHSLKIE
ncbi:conserved hypothetical protein [Methanococcus maripaludis C5]|uniref:Uncharacterized protein n=1 Tax=Methanococcus maripaludis (strain C5 / ATCC BAA-1333) TaxID=402880 RepID=A4FX85_METM5|nr:hypothetical protein [Methanococcus maripaludis]ABO34814.1 conserved hypothetical protein [Methanococcus maripaludis C5]